MSKSEAKHYVILFRDAGCQFRAIYEYYPEREDIFKLTGNGPKQLHNKMMDRFYKYVFSQKLLILFSDKVHIKSLHNTPSLQGKMEPPNHCLAVQNQHNLH